MNNQDETANHVYYWTAFSSMANLSYTCANCPLAHMTGALGSSLTLLSHLEELHWHILYTSYCLFYNSSLYCFLVAGVFYFRMADV